MSDSPVDDHYPGLASLGARVPHSSGMERRVTPHLGRKQLLLIASLCALGVCLAVFILIAPGRIGRLTYVTLIGIGDVAGFVTAGAGAALEFRARRRLVGALLALLALICVGLAYDTVVQLLRLPSA